MKHTITKKFISIAICLALILSYLPNMVWGAEGDSGRVADPSTMDTWKQLFLPDPLNTENAGGVWTDKSVFTDASVFAGTGIRQHHADSFLVALSAIASTMTVTGMSNVPTDTMLVLDVSGSMNDDMDNNDVAEELVAAANTSIQTLLDTNKNNRVGVVLYSGPHAKGGATSDSDAVLILPLGRYTTGSDGEYLNYSVSRGGRENNTETVSLDADVVYEGTSRKPASGSKEVLGGTYIQKGIYLAMGQFTADGNVTTVEDPTVGTLSRKPIVVLMSDGAPTVGTTDFTQPNAINLGDGTYSDAAIGFVTQLTAAYAKAVIEDKYGCESLFYTLGLGTADDDIATSVLNPASSTTAVNDFWALYEETEVGDTFRVVDSKRQAGRLTKIQQALEQNYVDRYFSVSGTSDLAEGLKEAFQDIVGQIQLQSRYFPTLISGSEDLSGYISFADRIGRYMDVKAVQGILIDNTLYSGADLARNFAEGSNGGELGTYDNPTALGAEMVAAVRARLGLDSDDAARTLIGLAYQYGQLSYTDENNFSNYIGWYANAAGQFLGFWYEGMTTMPEPTGNVDTDPAFIIRSYGYLGAVDESHGVAASDMMYATVQIRESIATGEQLVAFAVPAALIPVVAYEVTLDQNGQVTFLEAIGAEHPIRLVYEVGLKDGIDPFTLHDVVDEDYLAANTDADGNVHFYTNQYEADNTTGYGKVNTYSYFNPSRQNEKYYYLEDAPVYADTTGTLYTGQAQPSGRLYRAYTVYVKDGSELRTEIRYRALSNDAMATAVRKDDGSWYIPKGNVHVNLDGYTVSKTANPTGTLPQTYVPFVDAHNHSVDEAGYEFYVGATLGNNGCLTLTPATGIALTKVLAPGATQTDRAFSFIIENLSDPADSTAYPARVLRSDGTTVEAEVQFAGGKATVSLRSGETIHIGGMEEGTRLRVEEEQTLEYVPENAVFEVTVQGGRLVQVTFINADRGTGNLTVAKEVLHSLGTDYQIPADKKFTVAVQLSGIGTANATFDVLLSDGAAASITTDGEGCFTLELAHDEQITILGLPVGTVATVTEPDPGTGFTAAYWEDGHAGDGVVTIADSTTVSVAVLNTYTPDEVYPVNVRLQGTKEFTTVARSWNGAEFTFLLQKWTEGGWETIATATVSEADPTFDFSDALSSQVFDAPGAYFYQVAEVNGGSTISGITYDATLHTFGIIVTDRDMDGRLEIDKVTAYHTGNEFGKNEDGDWFISISFHNYYNATGCSLTLDVLKELVNLSGSPLVSKAGFQFGLYDADGNLVATSGLTDGVGNARLTVQYTHAEVGLHTYTLKEIVPDPAVPGMEYDETAYTVVVEVVDHGDGTTSASIVSIDGEEEFSTPVFTNTYAPKAVDLSVDFVSKRLSGRDLVENEFTFELRDDKGNLVATGKNNAAGSVIFDKALHFDAVGTWFYTVAEVSADAGGITYDKTVYTILVTVTDAGGELHVSYSVLNVVGGTIVFENRYSAKETTHVIGGTKVLTGRVLLNEEFTFVLEQANEKGEIVEGGIRLLARNFTDGSFRFPEITFTDDGIYYYVVSEQAGGATAYGIRYDETRYLLAVTVTDDGKGKLEVSEVLVQILDGEQVEAIGFTNVYEPAPTSAELTGSKILEGKVLGEGDFSFLLHGSDETWAQGELLQTVQNGADGSFQFQTLTFESAGTWYYLVTELHGGETIDGITYDATVYRVKIEVTDDLKGQLHATVHIYDGDNVPQQTVVFTNVFTPGNPITGNLSLLRYAGMLILSTGAILTLTIFGKKKKEA